MRRRHETEESDCIGIGCHEKRWRLFRRRYVMHPHANASDVLVKGGDVLDWIGCYVKIEFLD